METAELRRRFASSPVARLSTVRPDGGPHVVPIVFALVGDTVFSAVDAKPKRSTDLQRLANVRADARCALLVDHYDDDWRRLWWVRADGTAEVVDAPAADTPESRRSRNGFRSTATSRRPDRSSWSPSTGGPAGRARPDERRTRWTSASASRTASGAPRGRSCWSGPGGRRPRVSPPSATIGRVAYPSYEELTVLAAAGAVTERIGLMSNILLAPTRSAAELAKQAATVHELTGGRLTLGVATGARPDDYALTGRDFGTRGRRFDEQLADLRRAFAGEPLAEGSAPVVPDGAARCRS